MSSAAEAAQQTGQLCSSTARTLSGCRRPVHRRKNGSRRTPAGVWVEKKTLNMTSTRAHGRPAFSRIGGLAAGAHGRAAAARLPPARTILRRQALLHLETVQLLRGRGGRVKSVARACWPERRRRPRGRRWHHRAQTGQHGGRAGACTAKAPALSSMLALTCCIEVAAISRAKRAKRSCGSCRGAQLACSSCCCDRTTIPICYVLRMSAGDGGAPLPPGMPLL